MYFCFSGALKASIIDTFGNKIWHFLGCFWHLGSCMPKEVWRYLHNCCRMAYLSLSGTNMDPSWLQVGSSWAHVGPRSGSPAAPEPTTQTIPNPFPVASRPPKPFSMPYKTQHKPQKDSQTSNLDLHNSQLGPPKDPNMAPKGTFQGSKSYCPGPAEWGVASLNICV